MKFVGLLSLLALATAAKPYEDYVLVDLEPASMEQLLAVKNIQDTMPHLDFWEEPRQVGKRVRVMVKEEQRRIVLAPELDRVGISHQVAHYNIQEEVDREMEGILARRAAREQPFDINDFNTLADIDGWLVQQVANCPEGVQCSLITLGQSEEGRDIWAFGMSTGAGKQANYIDSTTHAREWLAPATNLKLIDNFMQNYGVDAETTNLLDNNDFYFVVVVNPDGYVYSWDNERLWRKNRKNNAGSTCDGVDLNRNFDFRWGEQGSSADPCSITYRGPSGNSELETQAVTNEILRIAGGTGMKSMTTLHCYGSWWMFPWGNTENFGVLQPCDLTNDYTDLKSVADDVCRAIQDLNGDTWQCDNSCIIAGAITGATDDWTKGVAGVKYAYNPECRGNSFIVDNALIEPSFQETWAAIKAQINGIDVIEGN